MFRRPRRLPTPNQSKAKQYLKCPEELHSGTIAGSPARNPDYQKHFTGAWSHSTQPPERNVNKLMWSGGNRAGSQGFLPFFSFFFKFQEGKLIQAVFRHHPTETLFFVFVQLAAARWSRPGQRPESSLGFYLAVPLLGGLITTRCPPCPSPGCVLAQPLLTLEAQGRGVSSSHS